MTEDRLPFAYPLPDVLMTLLGLVLFVVDVVLDVQLVVALYQEGAYLKMGLLLLCFLASTVFIQLFSGLWYYYDRGKAESSVGQSFNSHCVLVAMHLALLAVPLRYIHILQISLHSCKVKNDVLEGIAVYQNHDLSLLRLIEVFSESTPQMVFMIFIIMQRQEDSLLTFLKAAGSMAFIAFSVVVYHRSMRSFLPAKAKQGYCSSLIYFVWNLLLIGPRVVAVALFTYVRPCYIAIHFLILWMVLVTWAWRQDTDFMDNLVGEWLYRCAVGLIWYFSWFGLAKGSTLWRSIIYHGFILVDMGILLGFWWDQQGGLEDVFPVNSSILLGSIFSSYVLGLIFKVLYYGWLHPKVTELVSEPLAQDEVDFLTLGEVQEPHSAVSYSLKPPAVNKRMKTLADNFYSISVGAGVANGLSTNSTNINGGLP